MSKVNNRFKVLRSGATQYLVKNLTFDIIQKRNGFENLKKEFTSLAKSQYQPPEQLKITQIKKIKTLLEYSNDNIPFYQKRFKEIGFNPSDFKDLDDLKKIPILTKDDIREHKEDLIAAEYKNSNKSIITVSGGTTGPSIELCNSLQSITSKIASQHRFDSWAGWNKGDWSSVIWPAVVDLRKKPPSYKTRLKNYLSDRLILLQQTVIDDIDFKNHFLEVINKRATIIRGFPTQLNLAARYVLDKGLKLPLVRGVVSTGELLLPEQRFQIQKAFDCQVYDSYRTREVGCIAQECSEHDGLHVNSEQIYLEIDSNSEVDISGDGKILVTDLINRAMPFIRYEIGDIGRLSEKTCACGRGLPLLEAVGGRISDQLYSTSGKQISPVTVLPNMFHLLGIENQFRIIQEQLNEITIQMVAPKPSNKKLEEQKNAARTIFGDDITIKYQYVNEIKPVSSGKYPIVISKLEIDKI
jgi:phenylacetate-CoA ligase